MRNQVTDVSVYVFQLLDLVGAVAATTTSFSLPFLLKKPKRHRQSELYLHSVGIYYGGSIKKNTDLSALINSKELACFDIIQSVEVTYEDILVVFKATALFESAVKLRSLVDIF